MVELLAQLDHAEGERPLTHLRIHSLENVIVGPITLEIRVSDRAWDVRVASRFRELVSDLGAIPAVHVRDIVDVFEATLVKGRDGLVKEGPPAALFVKLGRAPHRSDESVVLELGILWLCLRPINTVSTSSPLFNI